MLLIQTKKPFTEPVCEITVFTAEDILVTSSDDWGGGEIEFGIEKI